MAVNKVVYNGSTLVDLTDTTAQTDDVKAGKVFYSASGERSIGSGNGSDPVNYASSQTVAGPADKAVSISMLSFSNDGSKSQSSPQLTAVEFGDGAALYRSGKSSGYAFAGCTSLTEITLPEGDTTVPTSTFQDCVALRQVTFPASVTTIEAYAFARCASLAPALEMPFQRIAACAFRGCTGLEKIWLRSSVETLEESTEKSNNTVSAYTGPFFGCSSSLVIYCEADEKPSGWSEHWNVYVGTVKFLTVVWGQKTRPW